MNQDTLTIAFLLYNSESYCLVSHNKIDKYDIMKVNSWVIIIVMGGRFSAMMLLLYKIYEVTFVERNVQFYMTYATICLLKLLQETKKCT